VEESNLLTGKLKIKLDKNKDAPAVTVNRTDVKVLRDAQIRLERDEINALKGLED